VKGRGAEWSFCINCPLSRLEDCWVGLAILELVEDWGRNLVLYVTIDTKNISLSFTHFNFHILCEQGGDICVL